MDLQLHLAADVVMRRNQEQKREFSLSEMQTGMGSKEPASGNVEAL